MRSLRPLLLPAVLALAACGGEPPAASLAALDPNLLAQTDGRLDGETSHLDRPTPIRDALTGAVLLAGLAYAGYRQPELVFQLAGFRLC